MKLLILLFLPLSLCSQIWQSSLVNIDTSGHLTYFPDSNNFIIPDYSVVGYKGNGVLDIPSSIPIVHTINPIAGDNTNHIQSAINYVSSLPIQSNGFRGALKLNAGTYYTSNTLTLRASGVVIYGDGDGATSSSNTIIHCTSTSQIAMLDVGAGNKNEWWESKVPATQTNITDSIVPVGSKTFTVQNASSYNVGDNIIIYYPFTNALLAAIDYGGTQGGPNWTTSYFSTRAIRYNTFITNITGNTITTVSPVFYTLNKSLSQPYIYKYDNSNLVTNIGIENIRFDMDYTSSTDESHPVTCLSVTEAENVWVRHCTALHFVRYGFVTYSANYVTFDNCESLDPISQITGYRRYNFGVEVGSQNTLFSNCHTRNARHAFISNGQSTTAGMVVYNCTATERHDVAEGHKHWTTGILWDQYLDYGPQNHQHALGLHNRGSWGSDTHGWANVHAVAWNCDVTGNAPDGKIILQQPPTAQNYAIGCKGDVINNSPWSAPRGYEEGTNSSGTLNPPSLYIAQLHDRLNLANDTTPPTVPYNLDTIAVTYNTIHIKWNKSTDNNYVNYYILRNNTIIDSTGDTNYLDINLAPSTAYLYSIKAYDLSHNISTNSASLSVVTKPISYPRIDTISSVPQPLNNGDKLFDNNINDSSRWSAEFYPQWVIIDYGKDSVFHTTKLWTYQNRAYQFYIYASSNINDVINEIPGSLIVDRSINTANVLPITDNFLPITARYVKIKVVGASGYTGNWISLNEFAILGSGSTAIQETYDNVKLIPNPAQDILSFVTKDNVEAIEIYSISGKRINQFKTIGQNAINISKLNKGKYFIKLQLKSNKIITTYFIKT